jgi:6-phosphogluconolactonase (cycloisomerase 2 family)
MVTETLENQIDIFPLSEAGIPGEPSVVRNSGGPFGFDSINGRSIFLSEVSPSALTQYRLSAGGKLSRVRRVSIADQIAACWVDISRRSAARRSIFVSNTGSDTISSFALQGGRLGLVEEVAASTRAAPIDIALSPDDKVLYVLNAAEPALQGFSVNPRTQELKALTRSGDVPLFANGLVTGQLR